MDKNKIALLAAVDVSYLTENEQEMLWEIVERQGLKIKPVYAEKIRKESGCLTEEKRVNILEPLQVKHSDGNAGVSLKFPKTICNKCFKGMNSKKMVLVVEDIFMRMKEEHMLNGQLKPAYNVQIAVQNYFIIHSYVSNDRTDYNTLITVLENIKKLLVISWKR